MLRLLGVLLALVFAGPALAQTATLLADQIEVTGETTITASGNVEVFYETTRLTAAEVSYDRAGDRLTFRGPITLRDGETILILADAAELDPALRNGILRSARLVLDEQLQIAAGQIDRVDGRYTQLTNTVASSCQICAEDPVPLWEIRARRVIHDEESRQLFFEGAQLRVAGVPVVYLPRMRMPDPTLERATGFLFPEVRTSTLLNTGLKVPYFITFGDHADLTLTPFLSDVTSTLEAEYRQEFRFGSLRASGAISDDTLQDDARSYLFAAGRFYLPNDFQFKFDVELVSDPAYLIDYDFSSKDRLDSAFGISRTRADQDIDASITFFRTLRGSELPIKDEIADRYASGSYTRRLPTGALGGDAWLTFDAAALVRPSSDDAVGRDVARIGLSLDWRRDWIVGPGILAGLEAQLRGDSYAVSQDSAFADAIGRATPAVAAEFRWPFSRTDATGATHLLEPIAQIAWSEGRGDVVPNEDSTLVEFDEGNLISLSRFPGADRTEEGLRANLGLAWTRHDPDGWSFGSTVGQVFHAEADPDFVEGTGLSGTVSDWLVAFHYRSGDALNITSRALFDGDLSFSKTETRLEWTGPRATIASTYTWLEAIPEEDRDELASELTLDAAWRFDRHWTGRVDWRFDANAGEPAKAGVGLRYQNECVGLDLSLSRRFTSSATVLPTTDFSFRVSLDGFGTGVDAREFRRSCRG